MATPREIRRRIISVKNTQKITKAMQMVASVKLKRARDKTIAARPYSEKLKQIVESIVSFVPPKSSTFIKAKNDIKNVCILVVGSDKGLCGSFNANVVKRTIRVLLENKDKNCKLIVIGKKPFETLKRKQVNISYSFTDIMISPKYSNAALIGNKILKEYADGTIDKVIAIYNYFKSPASSEVISETILPLEIEKKDVSKALYIFEPEPEETFDSLFTHYFIGQIWKIFLESNSAQLAASMTTMYAATKNAGKLIDSLTLYYNKVRQGIITKELLEIVSGAEALR